MRSRRNIAAALGGWSARHRKTAIFGWLLLVVVATLIGGAAGQVSLTDAELGTGDSGRAERILADAGIADPAGELVLVHSDRLTADAPAFRAAVGAVTGGVRRTGQVQHVVDPYGAGLVSADRHDALVRFELAGDPDTASDRVQPVLDAVAAAAAAHPAVTASEFGGASGGKLIGDSVGRDFARAEWTAVPLALGILLVAFGALVAALLPVALALTAYVAAAGLLAVVSHAVHVGDSANSVMLLIGLAVGVDYCLFYLRRERSERAAGRDRQTALRIAAATSGRSILISGLTVMVAMAGMFLSGLLLFQGFALATIMVVLIAVTGSVTVLPALLSMLGDRVDRGRLPFIGRRRAGGSGRLWTAVLGKVLARPGLSAALSAAALLVLAAPAVGLRTESLPIEKLLPADSALVQTYQRVGAAFPGAPAPAQVVVRVPDVTAPEVRQAIAAFSAAAAGNPQLGRPAEPVVHRAANVVQIDVPLAGSGSDDRSRQALRTLRETVLPATFGRVPGATALVRGDLASSVDFNDQLRRSIVPVFVFVLAVTFLLMLVSFGSVVVAGTSIVLNLLSVAAAYGVLVAVFQHGWGAGLIGTHAPGAVEAWIPLFVFVVLFGLSMDYHVFVVSRIREAADAGMPTRAAVAHGIRVTAGAVTSAAVIMVAVFAVFGTLSMQDFKQLGVGLGVAVLLDATIVRAVLLPSVMALLGDRNWYLPPGLRWLPQAVHRTAGAGRHAAGPDAAGWDGAGWRPPEPDRPRMPVRQPVAETGRQPVRQPVR